MTFFRHLGWRQYEVCCVVYRHGSSCRNTASASIYDFIENRYNF